MSGNRNRHGGSSRSASASPTDRLLPITNTSSANLAPPSPPLAPTPQPLHITVRFSTSLPDLHLDILNPAKTTVVALKHLIRERLAAQGSPTRKYKDVVDKTKPKSKTDASDNTQTPETTAAAASASKCRLRFIHSGKILPDNAPLNTVLRVPPPPPQSSVSVSSKGKNVQGRSPAPAQRVYVNCSIGDELSESDLAEEAALASSQPQPSRTGTQTRNGRTTAIGGALHLDTSTSTLSHRRSPSSQQQTPETRPLGFDRLLSAGLAPSEIHHLRLQFRTIQANRFTPDTMPSPDTLRRMEDAWIDNNPTSLAGAGGGGEVEGGGGGGQQVDDDDGRLAAVVDALVKGMFVGFVWPLGVLGWLLREEGVMSRRGMVFVVFGVGVSLAVGVLRGLTAGGEDG